MRRQLRWFAVCTLVVVAGPWARGGAFAKSSGTSDPGQSAPTCTLPPNDNCASPAVIASLPAVQLENTCGATNEVNEPTTTCASTDVPTQSHSVWFSYTNTTFATQTLLATTFGSNFDTVVQVYTGACGALLPLACNDDSPSGTQSLLTFKVDPGQTVLIKVASYRSNAGANLQFNLSLLVAQPAPAMRPIALALAAALLAIGGGMIVRRRAA